jgi:hypothetical protein
MIIRPWTVSLQKGEMPVKVSALTIMPSNKDPNNTPGTDPEPPKMLTPPMTHAATV